MSGADRADERGLGPVSRLLLLPIRGYQRFISPALPPSCRFYPTCSAYAVTAITVHGPVRGLWLAVRRLGRCHPFNSGGVDHVPPRKSRKSGFGSYSSVPDVDPSGHTHDPAGDSHRSSAVSVTGTRTLARPRPREVLK